MPQPTRPVSAITGRIGFAAHPRSITELAGPNEIPRLDARDRPEAEIGADAELDSTIVPEAQIPSSVADPRAVFVTGAAGFLGAHLVWQLATQTDAEIRCLVRAADAPAAHTRVMDTMQRYRLWHPDIAARVVAFAGDLTEPEFGLAAAEYRTQCAEVDVVIHNGARVNHAEPYARLRAANVTGTESILRFACTGPSKPVHFVSTTSVGSATVAGPRLTVHEASRPGLEVLAGNGYVLSKWVGEELVAQAADRGLPTVIHRPDRICGSSRTGATSPDDAVWLLIRAAVLLGGAPPSSGAELSLVPADYVAAAIVRIMTAGTEAAVHHLVNRTYLPLDTVWERLRGKGFDVDVTSVTELAARLAVDAGTDRDLARALILGERATFTGYRPTWDDANTRHALSGSGIVCPPMTAELIDRHIDYFIDTGFLPRPA
ncbi:thioester reductase domain-containing protein [Nocardia sp. NPDC059180]|uniref:thioester reductase domain-containing protein n=1 Tax=Nocardia sp. NPDC059180 TaxID=3346761 RepID=UPI0036B8EDBD